MEEWEVIVGRYQYIGRKCFLEACECADRVLKDDLAPSEIAWFVDTLLLEPVNLLTTIGNKWKDPVWFDPIGKAFKLLSSVIEKFKEECSQHFDNIVKICGIPFESRQRALALQCLTSLVPYCKEVANNYNKHLVSLSNEKTCKAPLAELIGAICSHHPDIVKSNVAKIWRVYLNLLDSKHSSSSSSSSSSPYLTPVGSAQQVSKHSRISTYLWLYNLLVPPSPQDTVMRSLLLGVSGVLKSFGNELDTKEFPIFYKHLVDSGSISKCRDVYLKILAKHADLFRELLANDPRIRMSLWQSYPDSDTNGVTRQAILSVYNAIEQVYKENRSKFNAIVNTEAFQFKHSSNCELKYTVLRVLHAVNTREPRVYCDMHATHALRHDTLTYEHCEMIQWCLEYNIENDIKLLKSVLVFYKNIPGKYLKEIAVNSILRAPSSDRKIAITFLANETCECYKENGNIDKYLPLWMLLFYTGSDGPKSSDVFLDFMEYLHQSLLQFELNENLEELPDRLTYLIIVSSYIIPLGGDVRGEGVCDVSRGVQRLLAGMGGEGGAVLRAARILLPYGSDDLYADMVKDVSLEDCADDLMLNESCLALVLTAARVTDLTRVLRALQIIFSRSVHFEAKILSRCLKTLDNLISTRNEELNVDIFNNIIRLLQKMQHNEYKGKDGRCLRKELFIFIGKYGRNTHMNENPMETIHLEKYMNLSVPVVNEGIIIKLNLQEIHNLALKYEDCKTLQVLLDLLYANLWERVPNEKVIILLSKTACLLLRTTQIHTQILTLCGNVALPIILWFQFTETVSNVDQSAASTALMHIGHHEKLASTVLNDTTLYSVNKQAFLNIAEMLVNLMKEDNVLAQKYLPEIILRTAKTNLIKANIIYKNATDLFIDKIELFRDLLNDIDMKLLDVIKQDGDGINKMADVIILKDKMKLTLDFIKQIYGEDINWIKVFENIIEKRNGDISRLFVIISIAKEMFDFDESFCYKLLKENSFVCGIFLIEENLNCLYLEGILNFNIQYAHVLVKLHLEDTLKIISTTLLKLKPDEIVEHRQNLSICLKKYENLLKCLPKEFIVNFKLWCKEFEIDKIAINIENDFLEDINLIKSLKILINIFDENVENDLIEEIKIWLPLIIEKHQNGIKKRFIPYFTDLLHIIFKFLPTPEIERVIMLEGFSADFMPVVFHHLVMNFDLIKEILHQRDVMKVLVKYSKVKNYDVLVLVDQLWPEFEKVSTFEQQYSLLLEVSFLPNKLLPESNPMQWLINTIKSETSTCEMKTKLIGLLPAGESYKSTWSWYVGLLPARLSEAQGESGLLLGALLEALIAADSSLLKTISQLIAVETGPGWWDDAIDASMVSLSKRNDMSVYDNLYVYCWEGLSLEVCYRLMVPLLRNSSAAVCEEFFSLKLKDLFSVLKKNIPVFNSSFSCQIVISNYIRALVLLRVCIEMVPRLHIESPKSLLYSQMTDEVGTEVFYLTKTLSMLCVDLVQNRAVKIPNLSFFKDNCLLFYRENYNSLVSAIWCRQPSDPKFYSLVFDVKTWCRIVNPYLEYQLPLVESWRKRTMHQYAGVKLEESSGLLSSTSRTRSTTRTYLCTLSENPGEFDEGLIQDDQDRQELCIPENVINQHPCAGILTMSLSRATCLTHTTWLTTTLTTLTTNTYKNAKWLLAQAICNCREDLKVHASTLSPALLTMVVQTSGDHLNSLHIDVIDLVIYWGHKDLKPDSNVSIILKKLVVTVIQNRRNKKIVAILMQKMNLILETFEPLEMEWSCLSQSVDVTTVELELAKIYIDILKTLTKKLHIRGLILELVYQLESKDTQTIKHKDIAFLFARCLKIMPENYRIENINTFRKVINKYKNNVENYVDIVLYAVRENSDVGDVGLFRSITKLLPKMVGGSKMKCLEILSLTINDTYSDDVKSLFKSKEVCRLVEDGDSATLVLVGRGLTRMGRGLTKIGRGLVLQSAKHCRSDVKKVREAAFGVLRSAVECLFTDVLESPSKRSARFSSPLLQDEELKVALAALGMKLVSDDGLRDAVSSCLPTEVTTRFCESFIISVYLPVVYGDCKSTNSLTALLYIFFKDIRDNEALKRNLITEHTIKEFPTTSKDISQNINIQNADPTETKTVGEILDTLLQFCKTGDAASVLILQLLKYLQSVSSILPAALTPLLLPMLSHVGDTTPFVIQACRLFIDECCHSEGFKPAVEELLKSVKGTEGEILVRVLLEDVEIRLSGLDYFVLGATQDGDNSEMMDLSREFSLKDVVNSFNSLSNWDNLTLQQQETTANLPPLWTCMDNFRKQIDDWKVTSSDTWFDKMLLIYQKSKTTFKYLQWQNDVCRWPKRQFTISATIDSFELKRMQDEEHAQELDCHIQPEDCLVEWAARIMTRSACIQKMYEDMEESCPIGPSHSHALRWCARANEMALPLQVLSCMRTIDECELSTLPWRCEELLAKRQLALNRNNTEELILIREMAVSYSNDLLIAENKTIEAMIIDDLKPGTSKQENIDDSNIKSKVNKSRLILNNTPVESIVGLNYIIINLQKDLNDLSIEQLKFLLYDSRDRLKTPESRVVGENKKVLHNMVVMAVTHYDENWPLTNATEQNKLLIDMTDAIDVGLDFDLDLKYSMLLDVLLHRMSSVEQLDSSASGALLRKMDNLKHYLDEFAIDELKRYQSKLSSVNELVNELSKDMQRLKQCLQLVADPRHLMKHYLKELLEALENNDVGAWSKSFDRMKNKIFENSYAGVDYQVLNKYKDTLYKMSEYDANNKDSLKESLLGIIKELTSQSESFKLSQLCPALTQAEFVCGSEIQDCLSQILNLPQGVRVQRFEEQVSVFTDSKRRPVVVAVRLSDGSRRRLLVKSGEELKMDAASMRMLRTVGITSQEYQVTLLSEDSGLIEFLEDHVRVRELIANKYDIKSVESTLGEKLIQDMREHSISQYKKMCSKIPAYAFRSVMELNSSGFQDFIMKKQNYEESLAAMTYATSLLGLKDRHLENILYKVHCGEGGRGGGGRGGCVLAVDWNSALRHDQHEPPPARLTRCLLAPCNMQVLENRLQKLTSETRSIHRLLLSTLQVSYKWMGKIQEKLENVHYLMEGTKLSHQVSVRNQKSLGDYEFLLNNIFKDFGSEKVYSVKQQVSNLLRHCTDPQILAITRSAWEPWI